MAETELVSLGTVVYAAVKPMFKIYFIIALGYFLAKKNILTVTTCRDISDCVVTAIMPCLIFDNVVSNLKSSDIKNLGIIFFTGTLLFVIGAGLCVLVKMATNSPRRWFGGLLSVGLFPNISDLPIAYLQTFSKGGLIFTTTEGNLGVAYVCIFLATQIFYQFSLGMYRLIEWDFRLELLQEEEEENEVGETYAEKRLKESNSATPCTPGAGQDLTESFIASSIDTSVDGESESSLFRNREGSGAKDEARTTGNTTETSDPHSAFLKEHESRKSHKQQDTTLARYSSGNSRRYSEGHPSVETGFYTTVSRTSDIRKQKPQDIHHLIGEYSEFEEWKNYELTRSASGGDTKSIKLQGTVEETTEETTTSWQKTKKRIVFTLKNFAAPNSLSLIISIAISMAPPLKALFISTGYNMPNAPDEQPPLSFIIDITSYVGAASVPLALLILGATISRLQVKKIPKGFWKTAIGVTAARLILLPIIGVGITTGFYKAGWYNEDKLIRFVSVLEFGLPNATALVYFTAFYTDPHSEDHLQMDCLAICLIFQYSVLFITLPFLISFTLKVSLAL